MLVFLFNKLRSNIFYVSKGVFGGISKNVDAYNNYRYAKKYTRRGNNRKFTCIFGILVDILLANATKCMGIHQDINLGQEIL